ncbi:hypothetical protein E2C01_061253 [Portunus trituberculatus]|uniref:Uncharacterized protein n=1 Tax=Portunus trituberculatus TaxID=210409 RepID=A0A5B7HDW3_PORTR|nr:hypothetical protein [Portunus trituberculatus]
MSQQKSPEGHWWSLGQQKLSSRCLKTADPNWQREDSGSDGPNVLPLLPVLLQTSPNSFGTSTAPLARSLRPLEWPRKNHRERKESLVLGAGGDRTEGGADVVLL